MLIKDFIDKFEKLIPPQLQDEWDNSGWQFIGDNKEIKSILTCVDVTREVIDQAIAEDVNLIISHHPILFKSTKSINYDNFISEKLIKAIEHGIAIYSSHTAIDINANGLNTYVFKKMGFKSKKKLSLTIDKHGYGDIDEFPKRRAWDLIEQIKERLDLDHVIFYGDEYKEVGKIALVTGSGSSFIGDCIKEDVELFITADISHHNALDALEQGLMVIDLGHYKSERDFNQLIYEIGREIAPEIKIINEREEEKYLRKII